MALPGEGRLPGAGAAPASSARQPGNGNERRGGGQVGQLRGEGGRLCAARGSMRGAAGAAPVRAAGDSGTEVEMEMGMGPGPWPGPRWAGAALRASPLGAAGPSPSSWVTQSCVLMAFSEVRWLSDLVVPLRCSSGFVLVSQ